MGHKINKRPGDTIAREKWGSKLAFILAASGSAIGLGNIWKFPYVTGAYGGGAFVLVYLAIVLLIGVPIMLAELTLGRTSERNPVGAYGFISSKWKFAGYLNVLAPFMILGFYTVVGGWTLAYMVRSVTGAFTKVPFEQMDDVFNTFITGISEPLLWHGVIVIITVGIILSGVRAGIERWVKILMPALFILLLMLLIRALTLPGASEGLSFYLTPDFSKINAEAVLVALGQAFFSLSLGMGAMVTYGSYISKEDNLPSAAVSVSLLDTFIALIAGAAIFPAVFAFGFTPEEGPGLVFVILPAVFDVMPAGKIFGTLFFLLLAVAALTSTISMLEVTVSYLVDERKISRKSAAISTGVIVFIIGIPASLSLGLLRDYTLFGLGFFDLLNYISSNILLPLGGLFITIFVGWIWGIDKAIYQITNEGSVPFILARAWSFLIKYVAPIIIIVFLSSLGLLDPILSLLGIDISS